jgi:hypothetical protein
MTLYQLESLTEEELGMALYIVNTLKPLKPSIELPPRGLTWLRKGELEKRLMESFSFIKPEAHPIYSSLLNKLGIQHEIKYEQPPTGSIS